MSPNNLKRALIAVFVLITTVILLSSCKKEVIYPSDQLPQTHPTGIDTTNVVNPWGKFLVTDAIMYVDDKQTGQHFTYNHFSSTKDTSSLRWGGPLFDIEVIIKNVTTYSFWRPTPSGLGKFELNSDTTKFYCVQYTGQYKTIIEDPNHGQQNMGGSSRPYSGQTVDLANGIVYMEIEEADDVDANGHPIHYWTRLTLKKIQAW